MNRRKGACIIMDSNITIFHPTVRCPKNLIDDFRNAIHELESWLEHSRDRNFYICHNVSLDARKFIMENIYEYGTTFNSWIAYANVYENGTTETHDTWWPDNYYVNLCRLMWIKWLVENTEYDA